MEDSREPHQTPEDQAERVRAACEELGRLLDARMLGALHAAASKASSWSRATLDPRGYLEEAGVDVPADTEVILLVPSPRGSRLRPEAVLDCYLVTKYDWGCTNLVTIRKPVMGPGGQPIDHVEVTVCVAYGLIPREELYCRFRALTGSSA